MRHSQKHRAFSELSSLQNQDQFSIRVRFEQSVQICKQRSNLGRTIIIALIVGTCLVIINQLGPLLNGPRPIRLWLQIGLNYLVPFLVSNLGVIAGSRHDSR